MSLILNLWNEMEVKERQIHPHDSFQEIGKTPFQSLSESLCLELIIVTIKRNFYNNFAYTLH